MRMPSRNLWASAVLFALTMWSPRQGKTQQAADETYQERKSELEQQLLQMRAQGLPESSSKVRSTEGELLTLVGERQERDQVDFEQSKSLFSKPNIYQIPVLYVTDRRRSPQGTFLAESLPSAGLEYGVATSTIKSDFALRSDFVSGSAKLSQDAAVSQTTERTISGMSALLAAINSRKADPAGKPRRILLFIHGYKNSFDSAVEDAARLASEVQFPVIPIAYSWPSADSYAKYGEDADQERISEVAFGNFISELINRSPVEVVLVAHSMGSRLLTAGFFHIGETGAPHAQLRHVIYAAADIAPEDFTSHWAKFKFKDVGFTIYSSSHDSALMLSNLLHTFQRLGDASPKLIALDGAYCIDATSVDPRLVGVGHSYITSSLPVASDIGQWIETDASPEKRGLIKAAAASPPYYLFP